MALYFVKLSTGHYYEVVSEEIKEAMESKLSSKAERVWDDETGNYFNVVTDELEEVINIATFKAERVWDNENLEEKPLVEIYKNGQLLIEFKIATCAPWDPLILMDLR